MDFFSLIFGFYLVYIGWWLNTSLLIWILIKLYKINKSFNSIKEGKKLNIIRSFIISLMKKNNGSDYLMVVIETVGIVIVLKIN